MLCECVSGVLFCDVQKTRWVQAYLANCYVSFVTDRTDKSLVYTACLCPSPCTSETSP